MPAHRFFSGPILLASFLSLSASLFAFHNPLPPQSAPPAGSAHVRAAPLPAERESGRENYVGDTTCLSCHEAIEATYLHTAHHLTSQLPSENSIAGKFTAGSNTLRTYDPNLHFTMTAQAGSFYQTAVFWQPPDEQKQTARIDIVVGSGQRGQSYLDWKGDRLYQLPVSYWTPLSEWVNSPGYADGTADFDRPVVPRCLECHATYFSSIPSSPPENRYRKPGFVLGISCERCHGPGRQHVAEERSRSARLHQPPADASSHSSVAENLNVVNPAKLPRDREIEVCAQCHAGLGQELAPAFSFVPGRSLADFLELPRPGPDAKVDVHGNQVALFERSRCFQSSPGFTCVTCHDVHARELEPASYSARCLGCHQPENCGLYPKLGQEIVKGCIDCHMPVQESDVIVSNVGGKQVKMQIRNHWIKVYATR